MNTETKNKLMQKTKEHFALSGFEGSSIRQIASSCNVSTSVIYHYWKTQEEMLDSIFEEARKQLGVKRKLLKPVSKPKDLLKQRIEFQFDNSLDVVFILKYYAHFRSKFVKNSEGFVPKEAYTHILEVLKYGVSVGEFKDKDLTTQAKVITHAINGFVLEYFPQIPKGKAKSKLVNEITNFIYRAIIKT